MSTSLLETENGSIHAAVGNVHPRRLDGLLADCLNCGPDEEPHAAGREGEASHGGSDPSQRRRQRFGGRLPGEHMDA